MKKCTHEFTRMRLKDGSERHGPSLAMVIRYYPASWPDVLSAKCDDCNVQLSLGPSNDAGCEVEIRAASLSSDPLETGTHEENSDWWAHPNDERDADATFQTAGYLARELATHDDRETRDADAWPWDVSRPVAGQYEEWIVRTALVQPVVSDGCAHTAEANAFNAVTGEAPSVLDDLLGKLAEHPCDSPAPLTAEETQNLVSVLTSEVEP